MTGASPDRAAGPGSHRRQARLDGFWRSLPYQPDRFQREAGEALEDGATVVVTAPTGSGKTLVAEAAVHLALESGERAFYTTPIKALSNQKFGDFIVEYGHDLVGLLTGDNSINGGAPIVIMTTEVLRNMIYAGSEDLSRLGVVILDEVHYLQDRARGPVWEEIIIHAPRHIQLVGLSATIANAPEFAAWVETRRGPTRLVEETSRPVPLESLYIVKDRWSQPSVRMYETFRGSDGARRRPNPAVQRLLTQGHRRRFGTPRRTETVEHLAEEGILPAIYFIFSRDGCESAARQIVADGVRLTTPDEREEIRTVAAARTSHLGDRDLGVLGYDPWLAHLEHGVAAHHAGLVPAFKETVEDLFSRGLVRAVFATETLALGINMPAKTVVLESLSKFTGEGHELLQPGDYTQLTGRAGRRGIDLRGYGIVLHSPYVRFDQVAEIAAAGSHELVSSFRPTYNMAANLVSNYPRRRAEELLAASFAQFQRKNRASAVAAGIEGLESELIRLRDQAGCELGDIWSYLDEADAERGRSRHRNRAMFANRLRGGDVVEVPRGRRAGRYLVLLRRSSGRGDEGRLVLLGTSGKVTSWTWEDLVEGTSRLGSVTLPTPFRPKEKGYQQRVVRLLRSFRPDGGTSAPVEPSPPPPPANPVTACPDLTDHLRAARRLRRVEQRLSRARTESVRTGEDLVRDFEAILDVLDGWGYVDGWRLTPRGEQLRFVYNELDLLLTETVRRGGFTGLSLAETAALASVFVFEPRLDDQGSQWPTDETSRRFDTVLALWEELTAAEGRHRLPETRRPEPGFAVLAHRWASDHDLEDFLEDVSVSPGDFVRVCRQILDLVRQIRDAWPEMEESATALIEAMDRGVVAAGGLA
jgi:ATP-dependent RNA helicase HelY